MQIRSPQRELRQLQPHVRRNRMRAVAARVAKTNESIPRAPHSSQRELRQQQPHEIVDS